MRINQDNLGRNGLYVSQTMVSRGFQSGLPLETCDILGYVRRGTGTLETPQESFAIRERQLFFLSGTAGCSLIGGNVPLVAVVVCIHRETAAKGPAAEILAALRERWSDGLPLEIPESRQTTGILNAVRQMVSEQHSRQVGASVMLWGQFLSLAVLAVRLFDERDDAFAGDAREQAFLQSIRFIDANIQGDIRVATLARIAGISTRRYSEVFRERTGRTVGNHIRAMRVGLAKERLLETGDVLQSSLDAGFGDLSNFYRVFRAETGLTPKQFIGQNGGNSPIITL